MSEVLWEREDQERRQKVVEEEEEKHPLALLNLTQEPENKFCCFWFCSRLLCPGKCMFTCTYDEKFL